MKVRRIPKEVYESLGVPINQIIYTSSNFIVREIFWRRLDNLISLCDFKGKVVLDFGCGEGALLPTLSKISEEVFAIDRNAKAAKLIAESYNLVNVTVWNKDINELERREVFDIVVCADVLEHFENLEFPLNIIRKVLKENGQLLISVPTENMLYEIGRTIFGFTKPADHYHSSKDVIKFVKEKGFTLIKKYGYPYGAPYSLSAFELCLFKKRCDK